MTPTDLFWVAAAAAVVFFLYRRTRGTLSGEQARGLVADGATLIDVRSRAEFDSGHLDRARNIPIDELKGRLNDLGPKEKPVVLYCASGMRSAAAARTLKSNGFTAVHNLGSMSRW